jgi:hypothetical protein
MAQNIILKRSAVQGRVPDTGSINLGEVAINTYDGKLYFKKSGSVQSIETIVTTNSITSGSIQVSQDITSQRDLYVIRDIITNGDIDAGGALSGSTLNITNNLKVSANNLQLSGSAGITGSLTVLGSINATQFNIGIISSSILYQSGSTKFGDTGDDVMQVTGSLQVSGSQKITGSLNITGSLYVNGSQVGIAPGPNTYDFNLDPNAAGTVNYITDSTSNTYALAQTGSFDVKIANTTILSVSASAINVTSGSVTKNYMWLLRYINNTTGDIDFNI